MFYLFLKNKHFIFKQTFAFIILLISRIISERTHGNESFSLKKKNSFLKKFKQRRHIHFKNLGRGKLNKFQNNELRLFQ